MCMRFGSDPRADLLGTKRVHNDIYAGTSVLNHKKDLAGDRQDQHHARVSMNLVKCAVRNWISNWIRQKQDA